MSFAEKMLTIFVEHDFEHGEVPQKNPDQNRVALSWNFEILKTKEKENCSQKTKQTKLISFVIVYVGLTITNVNESCYSVIVTKHKN